MKLITQKDIKNSEILDKKYRTWQQKNQVGWVHQSWKNVNYATKEWCKIQQDDADKRKEKIKMEKNSNLKKKSKVRKKNSKLKKHWKWGRKSQSRKIQKKKIQKKIEKENQIWDNDQEAGREKIVVEEKFEENSNQETGREKFEETSKKSAGFKQTNLECYYGSWNTQDGILWILIMKKW